MKALTYLRKRWECLSIYLDDPDVTIDTHHLERALRVIPMGKNYPRFVVMEGSIRATWRMPPVINVATAYMSNSTTSLHGWGLHS